jgi:HD-GYP domain-containing protein (c-di-GMP phosphodiesterase class II)
MKKVFVSVNDCTSGMQIAENIFNEYGAVIIAENTTLDNFIIDRIKNLGLVKVKVFDYNDDMIIVSGSELFRAQYNENLNVVKNVLHDISIGKEITPEKINQATDSIVTRINENRDIVSCINQMREADEYTYTHSINVSLLSMLIGKWLKYDYYRIKSLVSAGLLHDIGKGKISPDVLNKPGGLNKEEFEEIKKHPVYGYKLAETLPGLNDDILKGILMHHEREDGSGYPFGLKGDQIHDFAKIVAVADIYDAMTSNRVYKNMECPFDVLECIEKNSFGTLDHRVVSVFLKNIASYYMGDFVKLSTGDIGEIVFINPFNVSKPIIKVDDAYLDLSHEKEIKILELI